MTAEELQQSQASTDGMAAAPATDTPAGADTVLVHGEPMKVAELESSSSPTAEATPAAYTLPPEVDVKLGEKLLMTVSKSLAEEINRRRGANTNDESWPKGAQAHVGNYAYEGDVVPFIVVKVWNAYGTLNGQALLDGNDVVWVTSITPRSENNPFGWFR